MLSKYLPKFHREISQMHENILYWMRGVEIPVARTWIISSHGDYNFGFSLATFAIYANDLIYWTKRKFAILLHPSTSDVNTLYFVDIKISILLNKLLNFEVSLNDMYRASASVTGIKSKYILKYKKLKQYRLKTVGNSMVIYC
jgi:hypothetical protein